ncbi:MAG: hypothetical protein Q8R28_12885, partial [Dehalococcoidia bacterium]|nr:hypothetical protein [Dehalococcoidia bacterium]
LFETTVGGAWGLYLAGLSRRVGFRRAGLNFLLNRRVKPLPRKYRHVRVRHFVELVRYFGCEVTDRIPRWELGAGAGNTDLLVTRGAGRSLSRRVIEAWTQAGFTPLNNGLNAGALLTALAGARRVVGPPDSAVTLAQAMGLPTLRLTGRLPARDDCPGAPTCAVPARTPPAEALATWRDFTA